MQQLIFGVIVALVVLAMFGLPVISDQAPPPHAGTIIIGAGWFWGVEDALSKLNGVTGTVVGYTGGTAQNPSYEQVCSGGTGHAETVKVTFDLTKASYKQIVKEYLASGLVGYSTSGQYRSGIFYEQESEIPEVNAAVAEYEKETGKKIQVRIEPAHTFWRAEEYHQKYYVKHSLGLCRILKWFDLTPGSDGGEFKLVDLVN